MGLVARICRSISLDSSSENLVLDLVFELGGLTDAIYRMMNLAYQVIVRGRRLWIKEPNPQTQFCLHHYRQSYTSFTVH
jgi:hypothetical protein